METREYKTADKSDWGDGAWQQEPDKVQWQDPATGLPCLIVRNYFGAWCGYVGIAASHPWHAKQYSDVVGACNEECNAEDNYHGGHHISSMIRVHGGLTFSAFCADATDEARGICHAPGAGEPDHVWWFGFDCGHFQDLSPVMAARELSRDFGLTEGHYWNITQVRNEVTELAAQLAAVRT